MKVAQILFIILRFLVTINSYETVLQAKFKIVRTIDGKTTSEDLERLGDLEYPRRNNEIMSKLRELWTKYYQCLEETANVDVKPEIHRLQQGQYIEFRCDICARPFQNYDELEWKFKRIFPQADSTESLRPLALTSEMVLTRNKTLKIYNVEERLAGLYVCYRKESVISVYILEVSKNDTLEKGIEPSEADRIVKIKNNAFRIHYTWSKWTECNACNRVGKKFQYGTCYVSLKDGHDLYEKTIHKHGLQRSVKDFPPVVTSRGQALKRKILNKLRVKNLISKKNESEIWGVQLIGKFSTGIPCASQFLPKDVSKEVEHFKGVKVVVDLCRESCEKSEIFMAIDCMGKVVETANNSAGIYSMFQEFPQLLPEVERRTISADFGKYLLIHCPGTSFTDTPAIWKIKNKILFPSLIANDSRGRITIDLLHRIHIRKLRLSDSHIYSCWHKNQLVGTVHLIVEKKFSIRLNHHLFLCLIIFVLAILILVGRKMIRRELDKRNR